MIFDSREMNKLIKKVESGIFDNNPMIYIMATKENLDNDRQNLENQFQSAPDFKQRDWFGSLLSGNDEQFISAWFEIMVYSWLKNYGRVEIPKLFCGDCPDFLLTTGDQTIVIEAKAILKKEQERLNQKHLADIFGALKCIELPFFVSINHIHIEKRLDLQDLKQNVENWLKTNPQKKFVYEFIGKTKNSGYQNIITFEAKPCIDRKTISICYSPNAIQTGTKSLKSIIAKKIRQHRKASDHSPFIVAFFLENPNYSEEDFFDAWIGRPQIIIDIKEKKILSVKNDMSGLSFHNRGIVYKSVSGILVFRNEWDDIKKQNILLGTFLENPFADQLHKIGNMIFPTP